MSEARAIGVGVIGMGFMGWRHVEAYAAAERAGFPCRVVAICDPDGAKRRAPGGGGNIAPTETGSISMEHAAGYERVERLLADPSVRLVSVCTPTDSHVEIAIRALDAGKHVLVEKPVGLSEEAVQPLAEASRCADTLCMPAHCMRFWPGWDWLRERVVSKEFGRVISATFLRAGARPAWSRFYSDNAKSGGVLADFHIHDADFVQWCFGVPRAVCCAGTASHVTTLYRFGDEGPAHVAAEAGWSRSSGAGFRMRYTVAFEAATAEFEMGRSPVLTLADDRGTRPVGIPEGTGYDHEVRHIVGAISEKRTNLRVTMEDAMATARLIDAERRSLASGQWTSL